MIQRLKQLLHPLERNNQYKRLQTDCYGTISKTLLNNLLRNPTKVRSKEKLKLFHVNFIVS